MIVVNEDKDVLEFQVFGELTLADFKEFESAVDRELKNAAKIKLLLDFTNMSGYTIDVAWEDVKFTRAHARDYQRIAIISDTQLAPWLSWVNAAFSEAECSVFDTRDEGRAWLDES